jgi:hypothetical protein
VAKGGAMRRSVESSDGSLRGESKTGIRRVVVGEIGVAIVVSSGGWTVEGGGRVRALPGMSVIGWSGTMASLGCRTRVPRDRFMIWVLEGFRFVVYSK